MCSNNGEGLTFVSASIANILTKNLDADEATLLAAFLTSVADNIALIAVTK